MHFAIRNVSGGIGVRDLVEDLLLGIAANRARIKLNTCLCAGRRLNDLTLNVGVRCLIGGGGASCAHASVLCSVSSKLVAEVVSERLNGLALGSTASVAHVVNNALCYAGRLGYVGVHNEGVRLGYGIGASCAREIVVIAVRSAITAMIVSECGGSLRAERAAYGTNKRACALSNAGRLYKHVTALPYVNIGNGIGASLTDLTVRIRTWEEVSGIIVTERLDSLVICIIITARAGLVS